MLKTFEETISKYGMLKKGDRVLIGVSGGPDSMVLLDLLYRLKEKWELDLLIAHFNHLLRKEAIAEEEFIKSYGKKIRLATYTRAEDVGKYAEEKNLSTQVAARKLRYQFFDKIATETNSQKIALAHHLDDFGETVLMNFLRGPSPKGMMGIPPVRGRIIRPLIEISKNQIEAYAKENELTYIIDQSNYDKKYFRNRLRIETLPGLKEYNPNLMLGLYRGGEIFREEDNFLDEITKEEFNRIHIKKTATEIKISYSAYRKLHLAIRRRILRKCFFYFAQERRELGFDELERVLVWLEEPVSGKTLEWPEGIVLKYENGQIIIGEKTKIIKNNQVEGFNFILKKPMKLDLKDGFLEGEFLTGKKMDAFMKKGLKTADPWEVLLDGERISFPLIIRNRLPGDRFHPLGVDGRKKLKDFFIDLKIPREIRDKIPLVVTSEGEIIWVVGYRISEGFKVTNATQKILKLKFVKKK